MSDNYHYLYDKVSATLKWHFSCKKIRDEAIADLQKQIQRNYDSGDLTKKEYEILIYRVKNQ